MTVFPLIPYEVNNTEQSTDEGEAIYFISKAVWKYGDVIVTVLTK